MTTWILHSSILDRLSYTKPINQALVDNNIDFIMLDYPIDDIPEIDGPVVIYGSHHFVRELMVTKKYQPGGFGINDKTMVSSYMSNLPLEWFLNSDGIFVTWKMFVDRCPRIGWLFGIGDIFIRPNSGFKTFTGQVIRAEEWDYDINGLDKTSSVMPETLCFVAGSKDILGEFRFVIADGEVITGCEYRWDNKLDIRKDYPQECMDLAEKVAKHEWQVDRCYTVDVCLTDKGPKVVEINSFSSAGLYSCDMDIIVKKISKSAHNEYYFIE